MYGHWTNWENWSDCAVFPIDRSRKFSNRTRTCECNNCNNYCIGKNLERKICSCADGYRMGENEWLPCERCFQFLPLADNQGYKLSISLILFPATSLFLFSSILWYSRRFFLVKRSIWNKWWSQRSSSVRWNEKLEWDFKNRWKIKKAAGWQSGKWLLSLL